MSHEGLKKYLVQLLLVGRGPNSLINVDSLQNFFETIKKHSYSQYVKRVPQTTIAK